MTPFEAFRAPVRIASSGRWILCPTDIATQADCDLYAAQNKQRRRISPGQHMALIRIGDDGAEQVFMSDAEWHDHARVLSIARGRVLVTGLGLGCIVRAMFARGRVSHVTVVEREPDVIRLVWPDLALQFGSRLALHHADALTDRRPAGVWDLAWHDIWPTITPFNIPDMFRLRKKYNRVTRRQLCWGEGWAWADTRSAMRRKLLATLATRSAA